MWLIYLADRLIARLLRNILLNVHTSYGQCQHSLFSLLIIIICFFSLLIIIISLYFPALPCMRPRRVLLLSDEVHGPAVLRLLHGHHVLLGHYPGHGRTAGSSKVNFHLHSFSSIKLLFATLRQYNHSNLM